MWCLASSVVCDSLLNGSVTDLSSFYLIVWQRTGPFDLAVLQSLLGHKSNISGELGPICLGTPTLWFRQPHRLRWHAGWLQFTPAARLVALYFPLNGWTQQRDQNEPLIFLVSARNVLFLLHHYARSKRLILSLDLHCCLQRPSLVNVLGLRSRLVMSPRPQTKYEVAGQTLVQMFHSLSSSWLCYVCAKMIQCHIDPNKINSCPLSLLKWA